MSLRLGRRSMTLRGSGDRSRMTQTISKSSNRSITEHRPIGALKRHILVIVQNSDLVLVHWHPSRSRQRLSDCEDDPAKGAALNEVTQSIRRLSQRERLCHDGLDRTGLK